MSGAPSLNPHDVFRPSEVVAVGCFGEPAALTGRFARPATPRSPAVALMAQIARIGAVQLTAVQTLTPSSFDHRPPLPGADHRTQRGKVDTRQTPPRRIKRLPEGRGYGDDLGDDSEALYGYFIPADLLQIQNGDNPCLTVMGFKRRICVGFYGTISKFTYYNQEVIVTRRLGA